MVVHPSLAVGTRAALPDRAVRSSLQSVLYSVILMTAFLAILVPTIAHVVCSRHGKAVEWKVQIDTLLMKLAYSCLMHTIDNDQIGTCR